MVVIIIVVVVVAATATATTIIIIIIIIIITILVSVPYHSGVLMEVRMVPRPRVSSREGGIRKAMGKKFFV